MAQAAVDTEEARVTALLVKNDVTVTHKDVGVCPGQQEQVADPDRGVEDVGGGGQGQADVLDREREEQALEIMRRDCLMRGIGIVFTEVSFEEVV